MYIEDIMKREYPIKTNKLTPKPYQFHEVITGGFTPAIFNKTVNKRFRAEYFFNFCLTNPHLK